MYKYVRNKLTTEQKKEFYWKIIQSTAEPRNSGDITKSLSYPFITKSLFYSVASHLR